jgi:hypothetical protein
MPSRRVHPATSGVNCTTWEVTMRQSIVNVRRVDTMTRVAPGAHRVAQHPTGRSMPAVTAYAAGG